MDPQHRPDQDPQHPEQPDRPPRSAGGWSAPGGSTQPIAPGDPSESPSRPSSGPAVPGGAPGPANPYGPPVQSPYPGAPGIGSAYGVAPYQMPGQPAPYAVAQRPGILPLRPQNLGDVLEGSFAALRQSPGAVLGSMLIVALAQAVLVGLPLAYLINVVLQGDLFTTAARGGSFTTSEAAATVELVNSMLVFWGLLLLAGVLSTFLTTIAQGVLSIVVSRGAVGLKTTLGQAWRLTGRSIWSLVGLTALYMAAALVGMGLFVGIMVLTALGASSGDGSAWPVLLIMFLLVLAVVPLSLWLYVKVVLAPAAIAIEQLGPWTGIRRSWGLTRGSWWRTFGIVLLVGLIVGIVVSLISGGLTSVAGLFIPSGSGATTEEILGAVTVSIVVTSMIGALIQAIGTAYLTLVMAVLYIDYRIRRESFDLELSQLAAQVGTADQDARFATVRGVDDGSGSDQLVPGRRTPAGLTGPSGPR